MAELFKVTQVGGGGRWDAPLKGYAVRYCGSCAELTIMVIFNRQEEGV
jgi:hypothetical protein